MNNYRIYWIEGSQIYSTLVEAPDIQTALMAPCTPIGWVPDINRREVSTPSIYGGTVYGNAIIGVELAPCTPEVPQT